MASNLKHPLLVSSSSSASDGEVKGLS